MDDLVRMVIRMEFAKTGAASFVEMVFPVEQLALDADDLAARYGLPAMAMVQQRMLAKVELPAIKPGPFDA